MIKTYYIKGQIKEVATFLNGELYEGPYKSYYKNGQLNWLGNYKTNLRFGQWVFYDEGGQIETIFNYDSIGRRYMELQFSQRGSVEEYTWSDYDSTCYLFWTCFTENGELETYLLYPDCRERFGRITDFYPNGQIKMCGQTKDGANDGFIEYFDEQGVLIKTEYFEEGELIKTEIPE